MKKAIITGITGQDGSYLAELLLSKGYEVHGIIRRVALEDPSHRLWRIRHLLDQIQLHSASLESYASLFNTIETVQPDELYHLAGHSFVSYAIDDEFSTMATNVNGTHFILSAIQKKAPKCRFYFAATSEMFGRADVSPQDERTQFHPRAAYGISKLTAFHLTRNYRETNGLYACNGILFNHESSRRGFEYVTRKISCGAAKIKLGLEKKLQLGNLDARRDWGYAPDYVQAMWLMLQQERADDYVVATGKTHTVREFVQQAFSAAGLNWEDHVVIDESLFRPSEKFPLCGDATKARAELGWQPTMMFDELVETMVTNDIERLSGKCEA